MRNRSKIRKPESLNGIFNSAYFGLSVAIIYLAAYVFIGIFSGDRELALSCSVGIVIILGVAGFIRFMSKITTSVYY